MREDDDLTQINENHCNENDINERNQPTEVTFIPPQSVKKRRIGKLAKVDQAIAKLQKIAKSRPVPSSSNRIPDEYDAFAQHIATQLRTLPVRSFIVLQEKFQSLITKERLNNINPSLSPSLGSEDTDDDSHYSQSIFLDGNRSYTDLN